jgi:putative heme iron utilization protein
MRDPTQAAEDSPRAGQRPSSDAERARSLIAGARTGALSTIARRPEGYPFGSLVTFAADPLGCPILLLSALAEHRQNLAARDEASLLVAEPARSGEDPLALSRVTLLGRCRQVEAEAIDAARECFLRAHPNAAAYAGFGDFAFYCLSVEAIRYVGGFGRMSWVNAGEYQAAERALAVSDPSHAP